MHDHTLSPNQLDELEQLCRIAAQASAEVRSHGRSAQVSINFTNGIPRSLTISFDRRLSPPSGVPGSDEP